MNEPIISEVNELKARIAELEQERDEAVGVLRDIGGTGTSMPPVANYEAGHYRMLCWEIIGKANRALLNEQEQK